MYFVFTDFTQEVSEVELRMIDAPGSSCSHVLKANCHGWSSGKEPLVIYSFNKQIFIEHIHMPGTVLG